MTVNHFELSTLKIISSLNEWNNLWLLMLWVCIIACLSSSTAAAFDMHLYFFSSVVHIEIER